MHIQSRADSDAGNGMMAMMMMVIMIVLVMVIIVPEALRQGSYSGGFLSHYKRDKSTTTIAIKKRTAAIDSRRRIDPEASVPAPARPQEEGAHRNPHNGVGSRKGLAENATDATRRPTSERRRLRGSPHRSDDQIQSEREE